MVDVGDVSVLCPATSSALAPRWLGDPSSHMSLEVSAASAARVWPESSDDGIGREVLSCAGWYNRGFGWNAACSCFGPSCSDADVEGATSC